MAEQSRLGQLIDRIAPRRQARRQRYGQILDPMESAAEADRAQGADVSEGQFGGTPQAPEINLLGNAAAAGGASPQASTVSSSCPGGVCGPEGSPAQSAAVQMQPGMVAGAPPPRQGGETVESLIAKISDPSISFGMAGRYNAALDARQREDTSQAILDQNRQVNEQAKAFTDKIWEAGAPARQADLETKREMSTLGISQNMEQSTRDVFYGNISPEDHIALTQSYNQKLMAASQQEGAPPPQQVNQTPDQIRRASYGKYFAGAIFALASTDTDVMDDPTRQSALEDTYDDFVRNYSVDSTDANGKPIPNSAAINLPIEEFSNVFENDTAYLTQAFAGTELNRMFMTMVDNGEDPTSLSDQEIDVIRDEAMRNGRSMAVVFRASIWDKAMSARQQLGIDDGGAPVPDNGFSEAVEGEARPEDLIGYR